MPLPIDPNPSYCLCGDDVPALNHWLAEVRSHAPMAQPTAYRLAALLNSRRGAYVIDLTEPVKALLGPNSDAWNNDLDQLYREGLIAMWRHLAGPTPVVLMSAQPAGHGAKSATT
jgi:hypothetical protein